MYSVVLATMLAAGSTTPDWGHHRYSGCYGCSGYSCSGCYGGCYGRSSYGSCYGSCYGGCYGSYSGYGGYSGYSGYSGYGSYSGYGGYSCQGCYGCYGGTVAYSSCYGCCGGGGGVIYAPAAPVYAPVPVGPKVVPIPVPPGSVIQLQSQGVVSNQPMAIPTAQLPTAPTPARVTVVLPAEARLWVDQVECPLTSGVRSFTTPALNPNQQYFYTLRVEMARDGRTVTDSQRVLLTPGQETRVDFNGQNTQRVVAR